MATNNAINSNIPIEVIKGGTGAISLTDHAVLVGSGTSAITALTVGNTGELLVGVTSSDPVFGSSASANFTFTSATANVNRQLTVSNTDNTAAATSAATLTISTGGSSSGDPTTLFTVNGVTNFISGIDNSSSDSFVLSASSTLGTTNTFITDSTGNHTIPLTPMFLAYNSTARTNVTGDGTLYTMIFNTEVADYSGNYDNTTGIFQAPITGHYFLNACVNCDNVGAGHTLGRIAINTSNNTFFHDFNPAAYAAVTSAKAYYCLSVLCDMDTSDTAQIDVTVSNSTLTVGFTATAVENSFSGFLQG